MATAEMKLKSGIHLVYATIRIAFHMLHKTHSPGMSSKFHSFTSGHSNWWKTLFGIPFEICALFLFISLFFPCTSSLFIHCPKPNSLSCWPLFMHWSSLHASEKERMNMQKVLKFARDKSKNVKIHTHKNRGRWERER